MKNYDHPYDLNKTVPPWPIVLKNDCISIFHDKANALILLKWNRQITYHERIQYFMWAYDFSRTEQVKNWLIDDEEIYIITPEEKEWVTQTWTKLVAESGIEKIAVVTSDHFPNLLANVAFTTSAQDKYKEHGILQLEVFTEFRLAYHWLLEGY